MNIITQKLDYLAWRFKMAFPYLCNCNHFCRFDQRKSEWMTTGRTVTFCPACHRETFPEQYGGNDEE